VAGEGVGIGVVTGTAGGVAACAAALVGVATPGVTVGRCSTVSELPQAANKTASNTPTTSNNPAPLEGALSGGRAAFPAP
jgi:hypothetical protein